MCTQETPCSLHALSRVSAFTSWPIQVTKDDTPTPFIKYEADFVTIHVGFEPLTQPPLGRPAGYDIPYSLAMHIRTKATALSPARLWAWFDSSSGMCDALLRVQCYIEQESETTYALDTIKADVAVHQKQHEEAHQHAVGKWMAMATQGQADA